MASSSTEPGSGTWKRLSLSVSWLNANLVRGPSPWKSMNTDWNRSPTGAAPPIPVGPL